MSLFCCLAAQADPVADVVHQKMLQQHIPGLSPAVVRDGKVIKATGYGLANVELNVAATADTVYEIGSVTKQFTATAVMMLVEEGRIGLDDRIPKYLPGLPEAWKEITVRQLLTHTSGIKNYTAVPGFMKVTLAPATREEVIKTVAALPLDFPSGDKWAYSNTGYFLLGMILEKASGKSYAALLDERIFKPLQMTATRINDLHTVVPNRAGGYEWQSGTLQNADFISMSWPFAAGAIISTVNDMVKWDAVLAGGRLLKSSSLKQMWTPVNLNGGGDYGFGWMVDKVKGHTRTSHSGGIPGFTAHIGRFPDDKLTVIVLCNQSVDTERIANTVVGLMVPALAAVTAAAIVDREPQVTAQIKTILEQAAEGKLDAGLFIPELAAAMTAALKQGQAENMRHLGALQSIVLVECKDEGANRLYRYCRAYKDMALMTECTFNKENKIAAMTFHPE